MPESCSSASSPATRRTRRACRSSDRLALGATAARAVLGNDFKVSVMRGQLVESPLAPYVFATFHPSALLRLKEESEREAAFEQLVGDLKLIQKSLARP